MALTLTFPWFPEKSSDEKAIAPPNPVPNKRDFYSKTVVPLFMKDTKRTQTLVYIYIYVYIRTYEYVPPTSPKNGPGYRCVRGRGTTARTARSEYGSDYKRFEFLGMFIPGINKPKTSGWRPERWRGLARDFWWALLAADYCVVLILRGAIVNRTKYC